MAVLCVIAKLEAIQMAIHRILLSNKKDEPYRGYKLIYWDRKWISGFLGMGWEGG